MDVLTPEYIKMFVPLQGANVKTVLGELVAHRTDIDKGVDITIQNDDARRNVTGGELSWAVPWPGAMFASAKSGRVELVVVHDKSRGAHNLKPMYDGLCAGKGIQVGIGCEFLRGCDVMRVPREEEDERGINEAGEYGWVEDGLPHEGRGEDGAATKDKEEKRGTGIKITRMNAGQIRTTGQTHEAFMRPSTRGAERPLGRIAGARAIKTLTFWFSWG